VTVVVEAAWRSGASITAREAVEYGRTVAAVPGPVTAATSAGCHRLLRLGAVCVTEAADVAELVGASGEHLTAASVVPPRDHDRLDPGDARVFEALPLRRAAPILSIARAAGLDEGTVLAAVGRLEVLGLAVGDAGRWSRAEGGRQSRKGGRGAPA